jgi:hypothetical protein
MARRLLYFPVRAYVFGPDPTEPLIEVEVHSYPTPGTKLQVHGHTYTVTEVVALTDRELLYIHAAVEAIDIPMDDALARMHDHLNPGVRLM